MQPSGDRLRIERDPEQSLGERLEALRRFGGGTGLRECRAARTGLDARHHVTQGGSDDPEVATGAARPARRAMSLRRPGAPRGVLSPRSRGDTRERVERARRRRRGAGGRERREIAAAKRRIRAGTSAHREEPLVVRVLVSAARQTFCASSRWPLRHRPRPVRRDLGIGARYRRLQVLQRDLHLAQPVVDPPRLSMMKDRREELVRLLDQVLRLGERSVFSASV